MENQSLVERVNQALETVRPHLRNDGGDVQIVEITDDLRVRLRWVGSCENCSMSAMTMKAGIEYTIKSQVPEITGVEAVNGLAIKH